MTKTRRWLEIAVLLIILGFSVFVRLRLLEMPLERDEGEYAYAGQLMLQGVPPYQLAYNMKLPGAYAAYAVIMAIFGQTIGGVHLGLIAVNVLTIFLIHLLGRSLFGIAGGLIAAGSFALLSLSPSVLGLAAHATHFVTLFAVAGALCLWRFLQGKERLLFWSGLLFGLSFVMKQQAVFFPAFGGVLVFWDAFAIRRVSRRELMRRLTIFCAGATAPFAVTCLALGAGGVFQRFWFWTFTYASQYAAAVGPVQAWASLKDQGLRLVSAAPLLWFGFLSASLVVFLTASKSRERLFLALFLAASFASCCPGLYFRRHYFIPLLPGLGLALGALIGWGWRQWPRIWLRVSVLIFLFVAVAQFLHREGFIFFELSPLTACRTIYGPNPFPEAVRVGDYIRSHTRPADTVAVVGSEPEIYFYAHRRSATGFIYTYPLMEDQPFASRMQHDMVHEIEASHPEMVVVVNVLSSWLQNDSSDRWIFQWTQSYVKAFGEPCMLADIQSSDKTIYYEQDQLPRRPSSTEYVWLYREAHR